MTPPAPDPTALRGPFRLAVAMTATAGLLILFGAMVTSTGSGLAFADWPLADGQWMPERALTTLPGFLEHFHRIVGALVGLMILSLTIWVGVRAPDRPGLRWLCIAGLALTVVQGLIGGTGVLKGLPALNSITHGVLAQVILATFAITAFALTPGWFRSAAIAPAAARTGRRLTAAVVGALLLQLTLGAIARHTHQPLALWTHVGFALVVFVLLIGAAGFGASRLYHVPGVARLGRAVMALLALQILLGFVALLMRMGKHPENIEYLWRASLISAHVLVGALLMVATVLLCAHVWRGARPEAAARA